MTLNMTLATMPIQMGHVNTEKKKKFIFNSPKKKKKMGGLQVTQSVKGLDSLGPMHQLTFDLLKLGPIFFQITP